jgi:membrane protein required for colicin V production
MSVIDIVLLIIIGVFAVKGLFKGLIAEVFGILGLILGYVLSFQIYTPIGKIIESFGVNSKVASSTAFVLSFLLIYIGIFFLGKILSKFSKTIKLGWADKTFGFMFGGAKAAVIISIILSLLVSFVPSNTSFTKQLKSSFVSKNLLMLTPYVFDVLNKIPEDKRKNPFSNDIF